VKEVSQQKPTYLNANYKPALSVAEDVPGSDSHAEVPVYLHGEPTVF
jgi:hypothetical protein